MKLAIVGAGWAGLTAAVELAAAGQQPVIFEAGRSLGGRARSLGAQWPCLDNGQHILIGAYTETLRLMRQVGVLPEATLRCLPLTLRFPDGAGLQLPDLPAPLDVLAGVLRQARWPWSERLGLLRAALSWRLRSFRCEASLSVAQLCRMLGPQVMRELIEPLCVSALNTPAHRASAQVFLRVLQDALFGVRGGSQLLLPRTQLSALFPEPARDWLRARGVSIAMGQRIEQLHAQAGRWQLNGQAFDAVLLACAPWEAARLVRQTDLASLRGWADAADALHFEAIATVYAGSATARLNGPMLALRNDAEHPAQFVFDLGQIDSTHTRQGLLAFVVSASQGARDTLQTQVLHQARTQLGLELQAVQTVVEKRATFACTPGLRRPAQTLAPGLLACGDYIAGPYPATLEGAVRSGVAAAQALLCQKTSIQAP